MKKKRRANIIMVAVIAVVLAAGVFTAGRIMGWFGKPAEAAVFSDVKGLVSVERGGVAVNAEKGMALQKGDVISCPAGSSVRIAAGNNWLALAENTSAAVDDPSERSLAVSLSAGEAFARTEDAAMNISLGGKKISLKNAAAAFSDKDGARKLSVFSGEADGVKAGEEKEWTGADPSVRKIDINSLNDFEIAQLRAAGEAAGLVIAKADLDELEARRAAEAEEAARRAEEEARKAAEEAAKKAEEDAAREAEEALKKAEEERKAAEEAARKAEEERKKAEEAAKNAETEEERRAAEEAARKAEEERKAAEEAARKAAEEEAARKAEEERKAKEEEERRKAEEEAKKTYCYISIRCGTILDNMDEFDPAKTQYVPENGVILGRKKIEFTEGETVFDALKRACKAYGVQIEYSYNSMYGSAYIEGMGHIYEFDCGPESGWVYKVNGVFPNYGCSNYTLSKDDEIVWLYTCHGLGADVGGGNY